MDERAFGATLYCVKYTPLGANASPEGPGEKEFQRRTQRMCRSQLRQRAGGPGGAAMGLRQKSRLGETVRIAYHVGLLTVASKRTAGPLEGQAFPFPVTGK